MKNRIFGLAAVLALTGSALADSTPEGKVLILKNRDGLAIQGYDPVAYFTDNKPAKGIPKYQSEFEGAKYWFVSLDHKTAFDTNPAKFAPAYGGYCGYAASIDRLSPVSPEWFQVIDGKLILQLWTKEGICFTSPGQKKVLLPVRMSRSERLTPPLFSKSRPTTLRKPSTKAASR